MVELGDIPDQDPKAAEARLMEALARHKGWGGTYVSDAYEYLAKWEYESSPVMVEGVGWVRGIFDADGMSGDTDSGACFALIRVDGLGETRFYKVHGEHTSHVGASYYGPFERVYPKVRTVMVFDPA